MERHLETVELDSGSWLRLDCGHPAPLARRPDGTADRALCDRAQLPAGLIADDDPLRQRAPWPKQCRFELTPPAWTVLRLDSGTAFVTGTGVPRPKLAAPAQAVLVAGARDRIAPGYDADLTIQHFRHPTIAPCPGESVEAPS
ncbi:MAG: hypothetical protein OEW42_20410 [Acidimicrobiia bacterium]|nr:hypothetical protein [Acidimicrobiia bacterium]